MQFQAPEFFCSCQPNLFPKFNSPLLFSSSSKPPLQLQKEKNESEEEEEEEEDGLKSERRRPSYDGRDGRKTYSVLLQPTTAASFPPFLCSEGLLIKFRLFFFFPRPSKTSLFYSSAEEQKEGGNMNEV